MSDKFIISLLSNKIYIVILTLWALTMGGAYYLGVKEGFIPASIQCKENILMLDQCKKDKALRQSLCTEDLIKCKTECKLDTCDTICSEKVKRALESYKRLITDIKCGVNK